MLDDATIPTQRSDRLMTLAEAEATPRDDDLADLVGWVRSYLMQPHPDLGRTGAVCPFTKQAAKIDSVRVAISRLASLDQQPAFELVRAGFGDLDRIPCKPGMEHFRTVIFGFPEYRSADGIALLASVQARLRFYSLARFRMIGFMHAANEAPGLWNPGFRPLRAPMPVLAIRHMVEQDAPFAVRHKPLMVAYLAKFRLAGVRRLMAAARK